MNAFLKFVLVILVAALVSYGVAQRAMPVVETKETAFQRVLRTNVIRCGYYVFPPVTYRDLSTGKLSGMSVDMMETIARKAGMTVEWTQEVSFGNWQMELDAGRFDIACTPNWPTTALGRKVLFSKPMMYSPIYVIGREGDTRFQTMADVNRPETRISTHEANEIYYLIKELLPNATVITLPQNAEGIQPVLDVMAGKADLVVSDRNQLAQWNPKNPDKKLAILAGGERLKLMPFTFAVKAGENDLNNFLNNALDDMLATNAMQNMLDKWMEQKGVFWLPALPAAAQ
ncbi:MAG: substrate-binding periplasmic protein [Bdellovibrionales bacterium]